MNTRVEFALIARNLARLLVIHMGQQFCRQDCRAMFNSVYLLNYPDSNFLMSKKREAWQIYGVLYMRILTLNMELLKKSVVQLNPTIQYVVWGDGKQILRIGEI